MQIDLTGKVAVVTGGSRGLGREMVLAFARCGADVVIASRKLDACEALAAEVTRRDRAPGACRSPATSGRWDEVDGLDDAVYAEFGRVDILVNNAGMAPLYPSLVEVGEELFDKVDRRQPQGPVPPDGADRRAHGGRRRRVDHQRQQHRRRAARSRATCRTPRPRPGSNTLTIGFAAALGPTVRVNTIAAGPFLTDISKAWDVQRLRDASPRPLPARPRSATRRDRRHGAVPGVRHVVASPPARHHRRRRRHGVQRRSH